MGGLHGEDFKTKIPLFVDVNDIDDKENENNLPTNATKNRNKRTTPTTTNNNNNNNNNSNNNNNNNNNNNEVGQWSPLPLKQQTSRIINKRPRLINNNSSNNNNENDDIPVLLQTIQTTSALTNEEKIEVVDDELVQKLLKHKPRGKTQFDHVGKMKALTDFIELKLKPTLKSISKEFIETKSVLEQSKSKADERIKEASDQIRLIERNIEKMTLEKNACEEENSKLVANLCMKEKQCERLEQTCNETKTLLENSNESNKSLESKANGLKEELAKMKEDLFVMKQKLESSESQKSDSVANVQKLLAEKAEMILELGKLRGIQSQIESQMQTINERFEFASKECEKSREETNECKREIARLVSENENSKNKNDDYRLEIEQLKNTAASNANEYSRMKSELDKSKTECERLRTDLADFRVSKDSMEPKIEDLRSQLAEAVSENKLSKVEVAYAKNECEMLKKQSEATIEERISMKSQIEQFKKELEQARSSNVTLRRDVNVLDDKYIKEHDKLTTIERAYEQVSYEKLQLEQSNESKQNASINYEALRREHEAQSIELRELRKVVATTTADENSLNNLMARVADLKRSMNARDEELVRVHKIRRKLLDLYMTLKGNIRVFARVKGTFSDDDGEKNTNLFSFSPEDDAITIDKKEFVVDKVFRAAATQVEIFEEIEPLIQSCVLDSKNVCIFAFGQTGSGKTYTMLGGGSMSDEDQKGIIPRSCEHIFEWIKELKKTDWTFEIKASCVEIYQDEIRDLLCSSSSGTNSTRSIKKHTIRHDEHGNTTITDVEELSVVKLSDIETLLTTATSARVVAKTQMNEHSSRSHLVIRLAIKGENQVNGMKTQGCLNLVDLAGSERVKSTNAEGDRLKEAQAINKSLSALGDVIASCSSKTATHVPYRNSKLTYLLQNAIGGSSKTLMFVNLSSAVESIQETSCSLRFAQKVSSTKQQQKKV
jgi:kinesin family member C1